MIGVGYNSYSEAIRTAGRVIIRISQINTPKLTISGDGLGEEATVSEWVNLAQGTDYWEAWTSIQETVRNYTTHHEVSYDLYSEPYSGLYSSMTVELFSRDKKIGVLSIEYAGNGDVVVMGEYIHPGTEAWNVLYEGIFPIDDIDPITIGRKIASVELSYLAAEIGSCAAALDYWQTHPEIGWYSQSEWANLRGVNRQTINDRLRDAKEQLEHD